MRTKYRQNQLLNRLYSARDYKLTSYAHHVISCRHMAWNHWNNNWLEELRLNCGLSFFTSPVWVCKQQILTMINTPPHRLCHGNATYGGGGGGSLSRRKSTLHGKNIMYANIPRKLMLEHERFRPPHPKIDYFDNVMTKFIVNNKTDALKTDVDLFFTTNCQTVRTRWLTRRINY